MSMSEEFNVTTESLEKIFASNGFYKIPNYQRPYSWKDEEVERLWDDLWTAFQNNSDDPEMDKNYFLGSIVLTPAEDNYFDVVDGQQRLTTLIILFCVLRDFAKLEENYKQVITDRVKDFKNKERLKLLTQVNKQNYFEFNILNQIKLKKEKEQRKNNYFNTVYIFKKKVEEEKISLKIQKFIDYLLGNVKIIKIVCSTKSFAIKLFQIINTRGLDLSQTDLIKSFLLSNLDDNKHEQFISSWDKIKTIIKQTSNLDDFFTAFAYYLLAKKPKKSLSEEIENYFKEKYNDSNQFINDAQEFADEYVKVCEDKINFPFHYLLHQVYWKPILTAAKLSKDEAYYKELAETLKRFYYLYWIAGFTSTTIKQISFNLIKSIKDKEKIDTIRKQLKDKIKGDKINLIEICENKLFNENVSDEKWLKPLLILIEYYQIDENNATDYIAIDKKIHVEHILPQDSKHHNKYKFDNSHSDYIHKLANLTLLSGRKNIKASNKSFEEKKKIYRGKGEDGITGFRITQKIIEDYESWGIEEFEKRKTFLKNEINRLLIDDFRDKSTQKKR